MLEQGTQPRSEDAITPEEELKDPFVFKICCKAAYASLKPTHIEVLQY